jgi:hypothetical protein
METSHTLTLMLGAIAVGSAIWATSVTLEYLVKLAGKLVITIISFALVVIYLKVYVGIDIFQSLTDFGNVAIIGTRQLLKTVSALISQSS